MHDGDFSAHPFVVGFCPVISLSVPYSSCLCRFPCSPGPYLCVTACEALSGLPLLHTDKVGGRLQEAPKLSYLTGGFSFFFPPAYFCCTRQYLCHKALSSPICYFFFYPPTGKLLLSPTHAQNSYWYVAAGPTSRVEFAVCRPPRGR